MQSITLQYILNHYVLIIYCFAKKYTNFDMLTNIISTCKALLILTVVCHYYI